MSGLLAGRGSLSMSVVMPAIGVPTDSSGLVGSMCRSVVTNIGSALIELASFPTAPCHALNVAKSAPDEVARLAVLENADCAPLVNRSLKFEVTLLNKVLKEAKPMA